MISAKHSALGGRSLGELWLMTALGLGKDKVSTSYLSSDYLDRLKQALLTGELPYDKYYTYKYSYSAPEWKNSDGGYVETSAEIDNHRSAFGKVKYTVRFSNFTVGALMPADEGLYVQSVTENGSVKNVEASSVKNDTNGTVTANQSVSKTVGESLTSTVNHSSSYSFTEGLKMGAEASSFGIYKMSVEMSAQFSQSFSDGWSKSEAKTTSKTTGSNVSVTLPPYTNVLIKQGEAKTTVTTRYNCPVILGYKVTVIISQVVMGSYNVEYTFGSSNSNARKDLNHRAFEEGSKNLDEQKADWENILKDNDFKDAIQKITKNVPMSASGAVTVYTTDTTYSEIAGKSALYPLSSVELGKSNISFMDSNNTANMKIGNYSYTEYLTLTGLNARGGEYYGFDKSAGSWIVVDENQKEFSSGSAPVVLEKDSVSGLTKFRAVRAGTCYLKYLINEKKYPTNFGSDSYTKNADLSSTAVLKIVVAEDEVTYEVTGSYNGIVNSEAESLEGEGKLEVSVFDKTGKEIEGSYIWDKKQLKGINLTSDGKVSFTRPGNYHVRVTNQAGNIYSDWVQITAEVLGDDYVEPDEPIGYTGIADEGTTFIITGSYTGGVSNDEECIEGAGKLNVAAFDSAGREQAYSYTWEQKKDSDGMTLDEAGFVSFTKTGSYYVRVKSGQVYSDWTEINANELAPARFIKAPSANFDTYDGEEHVLLSSGDAQYEGGVSIVYALGSDDVNAPEEYNSEIPSASEAGKYYVWCKVKGDENHDDSEPVCVVARISDGSEPEEEDGNENGSEPENEPEEGSSFLGSPSGGCNAGLSGLSLVFMLSAIILRRKEN